MSRAGRKRKQGRRKPSGDLARPAVNYRAMAAAQPHRRDLPADKRQDQLADTELGRNCLTGLITKLQHDAGERYARIVGQYRAMIEGPRPTSGAGRGNNCEGCIPDDDCRCARRKAAYDGAYETLTRSGRRVLMAVNRVVIDGEPCLKGWDGALLSGLDALVKHFGLTAGREVVYVGNRKYRTVSEAPATDRAGLFAYSSDIDPRL